MMTETWVNYPFKMFQLSVGKGHLDRPFSQKNILTESFSHMTH